VVKDRVTREMNREIRKSASTPAGGRGKRSGKENGIVGDWPGSPALKWAGGGGVRRVSKVRNILEEGRGTSRREECDTPRGSHSIGRGCYRADLLRPGNCSKSVLFFRAEEGSAKGKERSHSNLVKPPKGTFHRSVGGTPLAKGGWGKGKWGDNGASIAGVQNLLLLQKTEALTRKGGWG